MQAHSLGMHTHNLRPIRPGLQPSAQLRNLSAAWDAQNNTACLHLSSRHAYDVHTLTAAIEPMAGLLTHTALNNDMHHHATVQPSAGLHSQQHSPHCMKVCIIALSQEQVQHTSLRNLACLERNEAKNCSECTNMAAHQTY